MRNIQPKNKQSRRVGVDLGLKTTGAKSHVSLLRKLNIPPGQHGRTRRSKLTDYGKQLKEKQKVRIMYGLTEKQLKKYFQKASLLKGNTAEHLIVFLETRLDNVLYRAGFTPTRQAARQLVTHGHIKINNTKAAIPSIKVEIKDTIAFKNKNTSQIPYIMTMLEKKDTIIPEWLKVVDSQIIIKDIPNTNDFPIDINLQLVVEFYSR